MGFDPCPNYSSNNPERPPRDAHVNNKNNSLNVIRSLGANSAVSLLPVRSLSLPSSTEEETETQGGKWLPGGQSFGDCAPSSICVCFGGVGAEFGHSGEGTTAWGH